MSGEQRKLRQAAISSQIDHLQGRLQGLSQRLIYLRTNTILNVQNLPPEADEDLRHLAVECDVKVGGAVLALSVAVLKMEQWLLAHPEVQQQPQEAHDPVL